MAKVKLAVSVGIKGLKLPGFFILDSQRGAITTYGVLHPASQDTALLPLFEEFSRLTASSTSSTSIAPTFTAVDRSRLDASFLHPANLPFTSSYSYSSSNPNNNIARPLAFQAKHSILPHGHGC